MAFNIDYNRGVVIQQDKATGINVYMYINEPGVYLSAHGTPVSQDLARAAGYDVVELGKKKQMFERMKAAQDAIRAEFEGQVGNVSKVVIERQGFTVKDIGLGRFKVYDPDGAELTKDPLSMELATAVFDQLVPLEASPSEQ